MLNQTICSFLCRFWFLQSKSTLIVNELQRSGSVLLVRCGLNGFAKPQNSSLLAKLTTTLTRNPSLLMSRNDEDNLGIKN